MSGEEGAQNWHISVEKVMRDEFGSAIWIRLKYFKFSQKDGISEKVLHHDLIFMPDGKNWVFIRHRLNKDFVPDKRYHRMAVRAHAIFYEKF